MNFGNIIIAFVLLALIVTGLVIWMGMNRNSQKTMEKASTRLHQYVKMAGLEMSDVSRAISHLRNLAMEPKVNAGRINAMDATAPGFTACLARQMGMTSDQLMASARRLELKSADVIAAISNFSDADFAEASRQKVAKLHQADLPRELDEAEQAQVIGGRTYEELTPDYSSGHTFHNRTDSMPVAADAAIEAAAAGETVTPPAIEDHDGPAALPGTPLPAGMKVIYINRATKKFASRAFAKDNPDQVDWRLVPALN